MIIYLAGGVHGYSYMEANAWREAVAVMLRKAGHQTINPMRYRIWNEPGEQEQFDVNELVHRDLRDVERSDIILVEYCDPERNYTGTTTEMVYARLWNKPVIVFTGERKISPWLRWLATKVCRTYSEAVDYIVEVFD